MTKLLRIAAAGVALFAVSLQSACSDESNDGVLSELAVTVEKASLAIGESAQASAVGLDQYDKPIATGEISWSATGSASVSATGLVTGVSLGIATVRATVVGRPMYAEQVINITPKPAARIIAAGGEAVVARSNKPFSIFVALVNADGVLVQQSGVVITANFSGGGTISGPLTVTTNNNGFAEFQNLSLIGTSGKKLLTFSAPGLTAGTVPLTLVSGVPVKIEPRIGNNQTATKGDQVGVVSVTVTDVDGYGVPGIPVTFTVGAGGGTVSGTPALTNAEGITGVFDWRLGAAGVNTLIASAPGVATPLTLTATATPRLASIQISLSAPSVQVGESIQATVSALDDTGAPFLPASRPQWLVNGNLSAVVTQDGVVTGTSAGTAQVIVRVYGLLTSVNVPVTGTAKQRLTLTTQPTTITSGTHFVQPPVAQLIDAVTSLPVAEAGHVVLVSALGPATSSGQPALATLTGSTTAVTDATGAARFNGLGVTSLAGNIELTFRSAGAVPVTSPIFGVRVGAPASLVIVNGDNQTAPAGAELPIRPVVSVRDAAGNMLPAGISVTFTVSAGGGSVTSATVTTDGNGQATVGSWMLGAVGANTLTVTSPSVPGSVMFTATARPF